MSLETRPHSCLNHSLFPSLLSRFVGRKKFNMDPKRGIEFLLDNDLVQSTSDAVANFLFKGEGLNKSAIGEYLGEKSDFNLEVNPWPWHVLDIDVFTRLFCNNS